MGFYSFTCWVSPPVGYLSQPKAEMESSDMQYILGWSLAERWSERPLPVQRTICMQEGKRAGREIASGTVSLEAGSLTNCWLHMEEEDIKFNSPGFP